MQKLNMQSGQIRKFDFKIVKIFFLLLAIALPIQTIQATETKTSASNISGRWTHFDLPEVLRHSQIKYFGIYGTNFSASLMYVYFSPGYIDKFFVLGHITYGGRNYAIFNPYPSKELYFSRYNTDLTHRSSKLGIKALDGDAIHLFHKNGKIRWDLNLTDGATRIDNIQYVPLTSHTFIDNLFDFNWNILWRPEFLGGKATGAIWIEGKKIDVANAVAYHDDTFGSWNFLYQPFFWFSFSGTKYHVLYADMYEEGENRIYGLKIFDREKKLIRAYPPGSYTIKINKTMQVNTFKFDVMAKQQDFLSFSPHATANNRMSLHETISLAELITHDGLVRILLQAKDIMPYTPVVSGANLHYGNMIIDDFTIDGTLEIKPNENSEVENDQAVGGMQYLRKARSTVQAVSESN